MKIQWLITNVSPVGSPATSKSELFYVIFGVSEPFCNLEVPSWAPKPLLKINDQCNSCGVPRKSRKGMIGMIVNIFWLGLFYGRGAPWWSGNPLEPKKPSLGPFNKKRVVDYQNNSCGIPCRSRNCFLGVILDIFWPIWGLFCGQRATLWSQNPFLSAKNLLGIIQ